MKNPHFFKAYSRLGLINEPHGQKELNIGVEEAPDFILDKEFVKNFNCRITSIKFPMPETISGEQFNKVLIRSFINFKNNINRKIKKDEMQIVVGGDHSVTFSSLLALIERIKDTKNLGFIHFDSHGDINLYKESPSKNFHGMYLRPFFDKFDVPEVERLISKKIPIKNFLVVGNLNLDPEEKDFFRKKKIKNISQKDLLKNKNKVYQDLEKFINQFEYLHVSLDVDVLDKSQVLATGIPAKNGLTFEQIKPLLKIVSKHKNLSFDLCEVNPKKKGAKKTIKIAQEILKIILS